MLRSHSGPRLRPLPVFATAFPSTTQVAERSLFLWNNEAIVGLVAQHRGAVVPAVLPALERNARSHWNPAVHGLTVNVRKMFQEMDAPLYAQCRQRFEHNEVGLRSSLAQWPPRIGKPASLCSKESVTPNGIHVGTMYVLLAWGASGEHRDSKI